MSSLAICDYCGGPAWWCLDQDGEPWYLCQDVSCDMHHQVEMFPEEPIWDSRVVVLREGDEPIAHNPG